MHMSKSSKFTHEGSANESQRGLKRFLTGSIWYILTFTVVIALVAAAYSVNVEPFRAFGGAVWIKDGVHYISDAEIAKRIVKINAPEETVMANTVKTDTPTCDSIDMGFCQQSAEVYVYKTLVTPAVEGKPAIPESKAITGYCTLCNDGSRSPTCATGSGTCSHHWGVAEWNAPEYRIIPGTPAVQSEPAVYNYANKAYFDSPLYTRPTKPNLKLIVSFTL
jgi:hypothetical protein